MPERQSSKVRLSNCCMHKRKSVNINNEVLAMLKLEPTAIQKNYVKENPNAKPPTEKMLEKAANSLSELKDVNFQ